MIISSTLAVIFFLVRPLLEFVEGIYGFKFAEYRGLILYIFALYGIFECLKSAYGWGKLMQYHPLPENTFTGKLIGCGFLFTVTISIYSAIVAAFILNSTQKVVLWNFAKKYPYLILFSYILCRTYGLVQWMHKVGMGIWSAPVTADKRGLKVVTCAAVLFHCQMLIHELYSWRAASILCTIFAVAMLCFDTVLNFDYLWDSVQRAVIAILSQGVIRTTLVTYSNLCDRASSFILKDNSNDQGYPSYCFL